MKKLVPALFVLIASISIFYFFSHSSDEKQILAQLKKLQEQVEFDQKLSPVAIITRWKKIEKILAPEFEGQYSDRIGGRDGVFGKDQILPAAQALARRIQSHQAVLSSPEIDIQNNSAKVIFSVQSRGREIGKDFFLEEFDLEMKLEKANDQWSFSYARAQRMTPEN